MLAGILVVTGMRDEVFIRGQQLGDDVLVLFQHVLNEHPGVVNEHGRVPLVNLFRTPPVVVLEHRPRTVEAEVLIKKPLHARQVFTIQAPVVSCSSSNCLTSLATSSRVLICPC